MIGHNTLLESAGNRAYRTALGGRMLLLSVLLALAAILTACGGGGPTTTTSPPDTSLAPDVVVSAADFRFIPPTVTVVSGEETTIEFRNEGTVVHNWTVLSEPVTSEQEISEDLRIESVEAEPGTIATLTFTAPPAGEYQIICTIVGHFSSGMEGTLVSR